MDKNDEASGSFSLVASSVFSFLQRYGEIGHRKDSRPI